jgi:hypothetical protein
VKARAISPPTISRQIRRSPSPRSGPVAGIVISLKTSAVIHHALIDSLRKTERNTSCLFI